MTPNDVSQAYADLGHSSGWVFMMTPEGRMRTADTAIVGLNPGGAPEPELALWDVPQGNAYFDEHWPDTQIQGQVRAMLDLIGKQPDDVFCAQFIPFRSEALTGERGLKNFGQTYRFSMRLWAWVLSEASARTFFCMGSLAAGSIARLLKAKETESYDSGWGTTKIRRFVAPDGRVVVSWPHPSRYLLFSMDAEKVGVVSENLLSAARPA